MKVQELLDSEDKWCQGDLCLIKEDGTVQHCLYGAILECYPDYDQQESIFKRIRAIVGSSITTWNDTSTFERVQQLVKELDI